MTACTLATIVMAGPLAACLLPLGAGATILARRHARARLHRRRRRQLPELLGALAGYLRAGADLPRAIALARGDAGDALAEPYAGACRVLELGERPAAALAQLGRTTSLEPLVSLAAAVPATEQAGGCLAPLVEGLESMVRHELVAEQKLGTATAQGRLQAAFIAVLPPLVLAALAALAPDMVRPLFAEPGGRRILCVAVALELVGAAWIHRILALRT